jgi:hypothetical protein
MGNIFRNMGPAWAGWEREAESGNIEQRMVKARMLKVEKPETVTGQLAVCRARVPIGESKKRTRLSQDTKEFIDIFLKINSRR